MVFLSRLSVSYEINSQKKLRASRECNWVVYERAVLDDNDIYVEHGSDVGIDRDKT